MARYLHVLARYLWLVVAATILGGLAGWMLVRSGAPAYSASAILLIKEGDASASLAGSDIGRSRALATTYRRLITTRPVLEDAARRLGGDLTAGGLSAKIRVDVVADTQLLTITGTDTDPVVAANVANVVTETFVSQTLEMQVADAARLQQTAAERGVTDVSAIISSRLGSMAPLAVVELAVPPGSPTGTPARVNVVMGAVLGLLGGCLAAFVIDYLRDVITSKDKFEERFDLSVLGEVPFTRHPEVAAGGDALHPSFLESWRFLRTNVQLRPAEKQIRTLLVSSAEAQVGKSTVVAHLAKAMAEGGKSVLVIDADLRRPSLDRLFQAERELAGVANYISDGSLAVEHLSRETGIPGVRLVASGTIPPNPTELLSSPRLGSLLEEASSAADIVLVDSPPALAVADATIMAPLFDGILMVADTAKTKSRPFARALEAFAQVNGRVIGAVLNKYRAGRFRALYDYGYGYGYAYGYGRSGNGGARAKGRRAAAALRSLSRLGRRAGKTILR